MSKKKTTPKTTAKPVQQDLPKLRPGKTLCVAAEKGHRQCNCGGPDCGENIGGR